jgi:hypothetical protein
VNIRGDMARFDTAKPGRPWWGGAGEVSTPAVGVRGITSRKNFEILHTKSCILVSFLF